MNAGQNGMVMKVKVGTEIWVLKVPKLREGLLSDESFGYDQIS